MRLRAAAGALLLTAAAHASDGVQIELLGEATVPREAVGVTGPIGGLSALDYNEDSGAYTVLSDDPGSFAPPRIYRLELGFEGGRLVEGAVRVAGWTELFGPGGGAMPPTVVDPEGLAARGDGGWWVASEGQVDDGAPPRLIGFDGDGRWLEELQLPKALRPRKGRGVRHNLALESAAVSPDGRWLFTATESALVQDGSPADAETGSDNRLLRYDLRRRGRPAQFRYRTEPIAVAPLDDEFAVNGLVDLLALGGGRLLTLERSYTAGKGNTVRLFLIELGSGKRFRWFRRRAPRPVAKHLLIDVAELGVTPDNLEGMTWGPVLDTGGRTLILVADDNFNPTQQRSQVIALAVRGLD